MPKTTDNKTSALSKIAEANSLIASAQDALPKVESILAGIDNNDANVISFTIENLSLAIARYQDVIRNMTRAAQEAVADRRSNLN